MQSGPTISSPLVNQGTVYWIAVVCPLDVGGGLSYGTNIAFPYHYTGTTETCGPTFTTPCTEHSASASLKAMPATWSAGQQFNPSFNSFYASHD